MKGTTLHLYSVLERLYGNKSISKEGLIKGVAVHLWAFAVSGARSYPFLHNMETGVTRISKKQVKHFGLPGEYILNMSRVTHKSALDPFDLTDAEVEGRCQARQIVAFMRKYIPGFENCRLISTGPHIGIRESRKINGKYKLTAEDLLENKMFPDAIAMGGYPIDIHSPEGAEMKHCFLMPGSWYSVPYGALVTNEVENLIVAGRCISATHEACAAIRVTPIVMAIGQAAGTAAAQSAKSGEATNELNTDVLRESLKEQGVFLEEY